MVTMFRRLTCSQYQYEGRSAETCCVLGILIPIASGFWRPWPSFRALSPPV